MQLRRDVAVPDRIGQAVDGDPGALERLDQPRASHVAAREAVAVAGCQEAQLDRPIYLV